MTLISTLLLLVLYFIVLMLDIAIVFVVIRIIVRWRPIGVLAAYNIAGRLVVDYATQHTFQVWRRLGGRTAVSERGRLARTLLMLFVARALLAGIYGICS